MMMKEVNNTISLNMITWKHLREERSLPQRYVKKKRQRQQKSRHLKKILPALILTLLLVAVLKQVLSRIMTAAATGTGIVSEKVVDLDALKRRGERRSRFSWSMRVYDQQVSELYEGADADGNEILSWQELERFQKAMKKRYSLKRNAAVLSPDLFMKEGGGDSEDWAIMTCGLLEYWGIPAYVAWFGPGRGHSLVFARAAKVPERYIAYTLDRDTAAGLGIPSGKYVPVDSDVVGGFSAGMGIGSRLKWVKKASSLYGEKI